MTILTLMGTGEPWKWRAGAACSALPTPEMWDLLLPTLGAEEGAECDQLQNLCWDEDFSFHPSSVRLLSSFISFLPMRLKKELSLLYEISDSV